MFGITEESYYRKMWKNVCVNEMKKCMVFDVNQVSLLVYKTAEVHKLVCVSILSGMYSTRNKYLRYSLSILSVVTFGMDSSANQK